MGKSWEGFSATTFALTTAATSLVLLASGDFFAWLYGGGVLLNDLSSSPALASLRGCARSLSVMGGSELGLMR
jgi:hypothetical protein